MVTSQTTPKGNFFWGGGNNTPARLLQSKMFIYHNVPLIIHHFYSFHNIKSCNNTPSIEVIGNPY